MAWKPRTSVQWKWISSGFFPPACDPIGDAGHGFGDLDATVAGESPGPRGGRLGGDLAGRAASEQGGVDPLQAVGDGEERGEGPRPTGQESWR